MRKSVENFISENDSFTTGEFARMLMAERPDLGRSTVYGQLARLCKSGRIVRIQKGRYASAARKDYSYELSEKAREIASSIINRYPFVNFQIWELEQLNEFVNHLLIRNTIFIEAESGIAVQAVAAAERQAEGGNASQRFEKDLYFAGFGGFLRALRPGQAGEQQENRHHQAHDPEPDSV